MNGETNGRVPFALVAVLLLLSTGLTAVYAAKLAHEEASQHLREAQMAALGDVADAVHQEVIAQSEHLAVEAIRAGTEGLMNETRIRSLFREGLSDYISTHFPRTVREVKILVTEFRGELRLAGRKLMDTSPPSAADVEFPGGTRLQVPDPSAPDGWTEVNRIAYFVVHGFVNYTLTLDRITLVRPASLETVVPVPAPLMETKIEQLSRTGAGDITGVGRTVKAILASLVQFRVLDGFASGARPGTTTADILTTRDVELAVNLAILLEEVRKFRTYDADAAQAIDKAHGTANRPLAQLLDRYAASSTLDAVDLYALYTRLDERGIQLGAVLAQAIAALADDAVLKHLDYLGLTPFADFLTSFVEGTVNMIDGFLDWLLDRPPKEAEYIRGYLKALFDGTGTSTSYLGPATVFLPGRSYDIPNGSGSIVISVPAHAVSIPFGWKDLLSRSLDDFWIAYNGTFAGGVREVHEGIRDLTNDVAENLARDAVLSGLLAETASGPVDPKDDETFLETVTKRVEAAVDEGIAHFRESLGAVGALMRNLLEAAKRMIQRLLEHLIDSYATIADESTEIAKGEASLISDLEARASEDSDFSSLNGNQKSVLSGLIAEDVSSSAWASIAFSDLHARDAARWRQALAVAEDSALPRALIEKLRDAMVGAGGWLLLARDTVSRMMRESVRAAAIASAGAALRTNLGAFEMWEPGAPDRRSIERFRVRQTPSVLRHSPGLASPGLRIQILDPAAIPRTADTPNVHYTRPFEHSNRPFQTRWTVQVLGSLTVRAETERAVLLGPHGLEPLVLEKAWPLDFTISVEGYSGWNLTGVSYLNSNDLLGDAWQLLLRFLDAAWDALSRLLSWVLDALRVVLRVMMELLEPVISFVHKVVEVLTKVLNMMVDLLYQVAVGALQWILSSVDWVTEHLPTTTFSVSAYGMSYRIGVNGPEGRELEIALESGPLEVGAAFVDLEEMGIPSDIRYDVVAWWDVSLGPFQLDSDLDPLRLLQEHILVGKAEWDKWWTLDLEALVVESYIEFSRSIPLGWIPIPPFGDIELEIGFEFSLTENPLPILLELMGTTIEEAFGDVRGLDLSLEYAIRFAESLLRRFSENVLEVVERDGANFLEFSLFIEAEFDLVTASPLGAGFRLAFVADGAALGGIVAWIAANIAAFLRSLLNPLTPIEFQEFPVNLFEHLFVRVEVHVSVEPPMPVRVALDQFGFKLALRVAASIEANLALFGSLLGMDWGTWEVNFGVYLELPAGLGSAFGAPGGWSANLWFLRGSFHPY